MNIVEISNKIRVKNESFGKKKDLLIVMPTTAERMLCLRDTTNSSEAFVRLMSCAISTPRA
jgi:hypothetical protein